VSVFRVDVVNIQSERMRERWSVFARDCVRSWDLHVNVN
jgi:hypothetical protein